MSEHKKNGESTRNAVRRILMASAALAPVFMYTPEAAAQAAPTVNAGQDRIIANSVNFPGAGELITLQGSGTSNSGGSGGGQLSLIWTNQQGSQIASGATPQVFLPDGVNQLTLTARDISNSSLVSMDTVVITVQGPLESAGGTPNQQALGRTLDDLCTRLTGNIGEGGNNAGLAPRTAMLNKTSAKAASTADLADRCFLLDDTGGNAKSKALEQWGAEEFNSIRNLAVVFSQTQFQSVMDRLHALRAGERGLSLAGLTLNNGGQMLSGDQVAQGLRSLIGGASADAPGGLLDNRLGFWMRGNFGTGEKLATLSDGGFDADQIGISAGVDYRFGRDSVLGLSLGYGTSDLEFKSSTSSTLEATSVAASLYGSAYFGGFYVDAVANYIDANYDTQRHVADTDIFGDPADINARGDTDGQTLSGGLALGYDFSSGGFTFAPSIGYYYVNSKVDAFAETGGDGLDLVFTNQDYTSSNATAGLRLSYAWKTSWGVVMPHFRGTYVHEFETDAEVFGVRFADDPFIGSGDPTPPIVVVSDTIDSSYFRLAAGMSLQMKYGISSYFDYQTIEGFDNVKFHDFTVGLRMQHSF